MQADVEKAQEGRNTILSWFGKGDLAKAKTLGQGRRDCRTQQAAQGASGGKARLQERHKLEIGKLRDGYQKEIETAIRRAGKPPSVSQRKMPS